MCKIDTYIDVSRLWGADVILPSIDQLERPNLRKAWLIVVYYSDSRTAVFK